MDIPAGSTGVSLPIYARAVSGLALTGKLAADFALWYARDNGTKVTVNATGIAEVDGGEYRLAFPDAAFAAASKLVTIGGTVDGGVVLGYPVALTVGAAAEVDEEALAEAIAPLIWTNATRTLTSAAVEPSEETSTARITRRRGDTWSISITGLGAIADREALWLTIKQTFAKTDTEAVLQVTDADEITVDDETAGDITIAVDAETTAALEPRVYEYDIQVRRTTGQVQTLAIGRFEVAADVTRATEDTA